MDLTNAEIIDKNFIDIPVKMRVDRKSLIGERQALTDRIAEIDLILEKFK